MDWLTTLRDQLPLLLVLSPFVGFFVTWAASRYAPDLTRNFAVSNCLCTVFILVGVEWQFESEHMAEAALVQSVEDGESVQGIEVASPSELRRKLERLRTDRIRQQRLVADGVNLFPVLLLTLMVTLIVCQFTQSKTKGYSFIPLILLFHAASLGALLANDVIVFLMLWGLSVFCLSLMFGQYGSGERRSIAERFLWAQAWGSALTLLGMAMLTVSVPWMKIQDSMGTPAVSTNLADLIQDIQKWTTRNELAFHYQSEVFPWMLLILSVGFAIISGLFPFHSIQIDVLRKVPPDLAILYLVGGLAAARIGWFRFVMPLSPDLLASFDEWVMISSIGGAIWGGLRVFGASDPREQSAYAFLAVSAISLMGSYTFTRIGMCGSWLMQQQLNVLMCVTLLTTMSGKTQSESGPRVARFGEPLFPGRSLLLLVSLPILCFFSSGFLIVSELFRESFALVAIMSIAATLLVFKVSSVLNERFAWEQRGEFKRLAFTTLPRPVLVSYVFAYIVASSPSLLLRQCEPEIVRVFRRFEQSQAAVPADSDFVQRQSAP